MQFTIVLSATRSRKPRGGSSLNQEPEYGLRNIIKKLFLIQLFRLDQLIVVEDAAVA